MEDYVLETRKRTVDDPAYFQLEIIPLARYQDCQNKNCKDRVLPFLETKSSNDV
jgi:hypothetical protein